MKDIHKQLNLDDSTDGDLVQTDSNVENEQLNYIVYTYRWSLGYNGFNYYKIDSQA